jgi:predicted dienelactone hydrolase
MSHLPFIVAALVAIAPICAHAQVGEMHRVTDDPSAAIRDSAHRSQLRVTIWYPAAPGASEQPILIGPEAHPDFTVGMAAVNATPAPDPVDGKRPVILLSHGFGGSARLMGWFGIAMARQGYVVVAVDHPGNNGLDPITIPGALLTWERAADLKRALDAALADKAIGPHIDRRHVGLAGFSAGGFTALVGAGARVDLAHFQQFCAAHPDDGVCQPQAEFPISAEQRDAFLHDPAYAEVLRHSGDDHSIPNVRAVFAMAPSIVQALDRASLRELAVPVSIILGAADTVAPPETNGKVAAGLIPQAQLQILPSVGHYDFLAACTPQTHAPVCSRAKHQNEAHEAAIKAASRLFRSAL